MPLKWYQAKICCRNIKSLTSSWVIKGERQERGWFLTLLAMFRLQMNAVLCFHFLRAHLRRNGFKSLYQTLADHFYRVYVFFSDCRERWRWGVWGWIVVSTWNRVQHHYSSLRTLLFQLLLKFMSFLLHTWFNYTSCHIILKY